jgi:uncharacterized protein YjaG (DUF416 family)
MNENTFQIFLNGLEKQLLQLPLSHQLAFAASCCERAYPNYRFFSEQENWGSAKSLRSALDAVWSFILEGILTEKNRAALLSECRAAVPDSDNFNSSTETASVLVTAGQEATFMVILLLEFCRDQDPKYGVRIATFARDSVDMQVQVVEKLDPSDPKLEEKIGQHPLMLQELQKQEEELTMLKEIRTSDELKKFRRRVSNPQRSNIGIMSQSSG